MIRRETTSDDGSPAWALISQIDHARIAGELATDWGNAEVDHYPCADIVLPTVFHHDDGWAEWEQQPAIGPASGKPLAFTEMPNDVAHAIWRRSIERVARWGPLAQFMVAEHFRRLRLSGDEREDQGVQGFLKEYGRRCEQWRSEFVNAAQLAPESNVPELAVDFLQSFDLFSLCLCCSRGAATYELPLPGQRKLALEIGVREVVVDPWPWSVPRKTLRVTAALIPAEPLTSDCQLRKRMQTTQVAIAWRLLPKSDQARQ